MYYTCIYYYTYIHASDEKLVLINITLLFTSSKTRLQVLRDIHRQLLLEAAAVGYRFYERASRFEKSREITCRHQRRIIAGLGFLTRPIVGRRNEFSVRIHVQDYVLQVEPIPNSLAVNRVYDAWSRAHHIILLHLSLLFRFRYSLSLLARYYYCRYNDIII